MPCSVGAGAGVFSTAGRWAGFRAELWCGRWSGSTAAVMRVIVSPLFALLGISLLQLLYLYWVCFTWNLTHHVPAKELTSHFVSILAVPLHDPHPGNILLGNYLTRKLIYTSTARLYLSLSWLMSDSTRKIVNTSDIDLAQLNRPQS